MRINSIQGNSKSNSLLFPENPASEKSQEYPRSRAKSFFLHLEAQELDTISFFSHFSLYEEGHM